MMVSIDHQERIRQMAASLSVAGLDAYVGTRQASLHYLVGAFVPWRGAVVVTSSGEAELIYWALDSERIREEGWGLKVSEWGGGKPGFIECLAQWFQERDLGAGRIGLDLFIPGAGREAPGLLFAQEFLDLQRLLANASLLNGTRYIDELMLLKTPEELELLRLAARAADAGFVAGLEAIRPGVTENGVAGKIENAIREKGSIWAWSVTGGTEVGSGYRTSFHRGVSQPATNKEIGSQEFIILDIHPMIDLYLTDFALPVFIGHPDVSQQRLIDCWEETVDFLLTVLKPDRRVAEVCSQAVEVYAKYGLQDFGLPQFGHGLGTCARLRPFLSPDSEDVLTPGMVFALGTHLYRRGVGGLRLEYPVTITKSGVEPLCATPPKVHFVRA